jgi:predicted site-specific integrase-resolvase
VSTIVVERQDRFARFGAQHIEVALSVPGRRLLVVNPDEVDEDLAGDVSEILPSFCVRRYGRAAGVIARDPS